MSVAVVACAVISLLAPEAPVRTVGVESDLAVQIAGPRVVAREWHESAPIRVWIVGVDEATSPPTYALRWVGWEPGRYDLADWLVGPNGSVDDGWPSLPVDVVPIDPPGPPLALEFEPPAMGVDRARSFAFGWREALVCGWALSTLVAAAALVRLRRVGRRDMEEREPEIALRPLVDLAREGRLTAQGRARLERLVTLVLLRRQGLEDAPLDEARRRLQATPGLGERFAALEAWLHGRASDADAAQSLLDEIMDDHRARGRSP